MTKFVEYIKKTKPCCQSKDKSAKDEKSKTSKLVKLLLKLIICCGIPVLVYLVVYSIFSFLGYAVPKFLVYAILLFCPVTHMIVLIDHIYKRRKARGIL